MSRNENPWRDPNLEGEKFNKIQFAGELIAIILLFLFIAILLVIGK